VGRLDDADRELDAFLRAKPRASLALVAAAEPYLDQTLLEYLLGG
jgi:hypothetical protein